MKPKEVKKPIDIKSTTEEIFDTVEVKETDYVQRVKDYYKAEEDLTKKTGYVPGTVRLMTVFELITDKSFPRKGKGKSTKPMILDAIIMAAIDKKLILQGAEK